MSFTINGVSDESPGDGRRHWMIRPWMMLVIVLAVLAFIIWGTLGLRTTGLIEEWGLFSELDSSSTIQSLVVQGQPSRPFLLLPFWIGYHLTPGSFMGVNLLEIVLFFSRTLLLYLILRALRPDTPLFAFAAAVLFAAFPADTGWFTTRYLSPVAAVTLYLLAVYLQIAYWRSRRWWFFLLSCLALLVTLGIYEASYPLVILTPGLFLWQERRLSRRLIVAAVAWYAVTFAMLFAAWYQTAQSGASYQTYLLAQADPLPLLARLLTYAQAFLAACSRTLIGGWLEALQNLRPDALSGWLAAIAGLLIAVVSALISIFSPSLHGENASSTRKPRWSWPSLRLGTELRWFIFGLIIIVLGFALFAPLPTHRDQTERVYMFSSIGGAICIAAVIHWLGTLIRRQARVISLSLGLLVALALGGVLPIVLLAKTTSIQEQMLLSQVVEQAPRLADNTLIVIYDQTHQLATSQWLFSMVGSDSIYLESALDILYDRPGLPVALCDPGALYGAPPTAPCTFGRGGLIWVQPGQAALTYPANRVVIFADKGEGDLTLLKQWPVPGGQGYDPSALIDSTAPLPPRVYTLLNQWPIQDQTPYNEHAQSLLDLNFVTQTRLFLDAATYPFSGYGWQSNVGIWMTATRATIDTWLSDNDSYELQLHAVGSFQPEAYNQLALQVNGQSVQLQHTADSAGGMLYTATLPEAAVARDSTRTRLLFTLPSVTSPLALGINTDSRFLSLRFDWLHITPLAGSR